jgi:hypothetical protein
MKLPRPTGRHKRSRSGSDQGKQTYAQQTPSTLGATSSLGIGGKEPVGEPRSRRVGQPTLRQPTLRNNGSNGDSEATSGGIPLTRRQLLIGAAGVAAIAVIGGGVAVAVRTSSEDAEVESIEVAEDAVFTLDDCTSQDYSEVVKQTAEVQLPYGSLVWAGARSSYAACLTPTDSSSPLTQAGVIDLSTGTATTLVSSPMTATRNYDIYDVRCSDSGIIWVEANSWTDEWAVWQARMSGGSMGTPLMVASGGGDVRIPSVAAVGSHAFWQLAPSDNDDAATESVLMTSEFGSDEASEVYRCEGSMATEPYATADGVVITPHPAESTSYYQLTYIDADTMQVADTMVLPSSMTPLEAGYVDGRFTFSFDSIYNYGGGIANLGTYTTTDESDSGQTGEWFRFDRTPTAAPAWCGDWFIVKSTTAIAGVDLATRVTFTLPVPDDCESFGDYLASTGTGDTIVGYADVKTDDDSYTLVRAWQMLA